MSGRYEDWAPPSDLLMEDCKLPQLYLKTLNYTRGFERRPYYDAADGVEKTQFIPRACDDVLVVCLKREDNGHEETLTFNGLSAGKFMELIKPMVKKYREPTDEERTKIRNVLDGARITDNLDGFAKQLRRGLTETFPGCILVTKEPTVVEVTVPSSMMRFYLRF